MIKKIKGLFINTKTNVKNYTTTQLLNKFMSLPSYKGVPKGDWFYWVRSNENQTNVYGAKCYHFRNKKFIRVMSGTTRTGRWGLYNFWRYNKKGVAIIKADEIYYDAFMKTDGKTVRHHNGKGKAFRLIKDILYYRDGNKNDIAEELGEVIKGNFSTNMHTNSYRFFKGIRTWIIGKSSLGCLVVNNLTKYYLSWYEVPELTPITIAVVNEF